MSVPGENDHSDDKDGDDDPVIISYRDRNHVYDSYDDIDSDISSYEILSSENWSLKHQQEHCDDDDNDDDVDNADGDGNGGLH